MTTNSPCYRLGIDGGGSRCRARLTDRGGLVLGEGSAGPANLMLGGEVAFDAVMEATRQALGRADLREDALRRTRAGLGLAAANVPALRMAFEQRPLPFHSACIHSDAETACLGAHRGRDGGVLILGTGSQGIVHRAGEFTTVGGWGFALSDWGSGAILGRAALRRAFRAREGIEPASPFTQAVLARFDDLAAMLDWATGARPREWGELAPLVFEHAGQGDPVALPLVRAGAADVEQQIERLRAIGAGRVALMGGLAAPFRCYLAPHFDRLLTEPAGDALDGALWLAGAGLPSPR